MANKIQPPVFNKEKSYQRWKEEVKAWQIVCGYPEKNQALVVALSFPEGSEVRDYIFSDIAIESLQVENGMVVLFNQLDIKYKKDNLCEAYETWNKFDSFKRESEGAMDEYIHEFDKRWKQVKKHNNEISSPILAFKLMDCAQLDLRTKQIVLTDVDFAKPEEMFSSMKIALRKYCGSQQLLKNDNSTNAAAVKIEPSEIKIEPPSSIEEANIVGRGRGYFRPRAGRGGRRDGQARGRAQNTKDWSGNTLKCYVCGAEDHFARFCPKNVYMATTAEVKVQDARVAEVKEKSQMPDEMGDSLNHALIDTACSSTVCGVEWLECYLECLSDEERNYVVEYCSTTVFKFGDGNLHQSLKKVKIPVCLVGIKSFILTDVVNCTLPLLWSKSAMKRAGVKLDLSNDTAEILRRKVNLTCTSTGHYKIPLIDERRLKKRTQEIMLTIVGNENEKKSKIRKIQHQFGHPSVRRLKQLLKDAAVDDEMCFLYAEEISMNCDVCKKYKKTPSRPIVSMKMAYDFNDIVAIDLKEYRKGKVYFLHMVDMATRFTRSTIVNSKEPKVIVDNIFKIWIGTGIGAPKSILCDNGGEWSNETFLEMCENTNISIMHTAAESAFSNGICERNHAIIDEMVYKIMEQQPRLSLGVALAWAVNSKNSLQMVEGYSPYQLVFGRNPNLPSVIHDSSPALEGMTKSEIVASHLNASHNARKAFVQAEASEKIRRALRHRVRPSGKKYDQGEHVYFKREDSNRWKGPATVIGHDGKTVILKYGSYIVRVHESRLQGVGEEFLADKNEIQNTSEETTDKQIDNDESDVQGLSFQDCDADENEQIESEEDNRMSDVDAPAVCSGIPKIGERVKFKQRENDNWQKAKVISRAGKATGKYPTWRNIEFDDGRIIALDWVKDVTQWDIEESEQNEDINADNEALIVGEISNQIEMGAKLKELENWKDFGVYKEVPRDGKKALSMRWVMTEKENSSGEKSIKARLVVRGFEDKDEMKTDSPTASREVLRTFISILSSKKWSINSIDIKAAFLQSEEFDREVYVQPPAEAGCPIDKIWRLKRCAYGLNDAARNWYFTMKNFLLKLGCVQIKTDPSAFY